MIPNEKPQRSKLIASLLGPMLIVVSISEGLNLHIWDTSIPQIVYLNGMILFAVGLVVVRFHNIWRRTWIVTITIIGWLILLAGLFRMFFPNAQQAEATPITYAFIALICLIGVFLSYKAYR